MGRARWATVRKASLPILGVYEKVLPLPGIEWERFFSVVNQAGFDFLELSIDPSPERLARLDWDRSTRQHVLAAARGQSVDLRVLTLSAHRDAPWGSADPQVRDRADALARHTINLAVDLDARCVQIAGYFAHDGLRHSDARELYIAGLSRAAQYAADRGIVLALENVDGQDVTSVRAALAVLEDVGREDLRLYVDVGNLVGNGLDVLGELRAGLPMAYCIQLKDARPGVFRRVPFGDGTVPFRQIFDLLVDQPGTLMSVEMWNDCGDPHLAAQASHWFRHQWHDAVSRRGPGAT